MVPTSSSHSHRRVPIETLIVLDPANPFIVRVVGSNRPTKSDFTWDMHPEHLLSTPIHCVSVSKWVILSECFTFACIATAGIAYMTVSYTRRLRMVEISSCNMYERMGREQSSSSNMVTDVAALFHPSRHSLLSVSVPEEDSASSACFSILAT